MCQRELGSPVDIWGSCLREREREKEEQQKKPKAVVQFVRLLRPILIGATLLGLGSHSLRWTNMPISKKYLNNNYKWFIIKIYIKKKTYVVISSNFFLSPE